MSKATSYQGANEWLVSPLIALPANASTITLRWNGFCEETTFKLDISTTGRDSAAQFTTTLFTETHGSLYTPQLQNHWSTYTVDLSAYRGQTISLAFRNVGPVQHSYGYVAMDTMWIECDYSPITDTVWRTVSVSANVEGACETYGSGVYADNSPVVIGYNIADTATTGGHWQFLGWNDGGTGNPRTIIVTSDTSVVALFQWMADSIGIAEVENSKLEVELYPNPASEKVTIKCSEPASVTIVDMQGRTIYRCGTKEECHLIDVSTWPAGSCFARIITDKGIMIKKLTIGR